MHEHNGSRRTTRQGDVGGIRIGGDAPIVVQSMTNTDTADARATAAQVFDLWQAGSELVRITVNTMEAAAQVAPIRDLLLRRNCDVPLVGDIDGDGKADLAVWRAPTGTWFIITSSTGYDYNSQVQKPFGSQAAGDVPLLPDFDGDGKADLAVLRAPTGVWFCLTSSSTYAATGPAFQFGVQSDVPMTR